MSEITKNVKHAMRLQRRVIRKRLQYAVMRNVIPLNRAERQITDSSVRVMANSIPKAGTNLLSRLMRLMPGTVDRWTYHVDESLSGLERQIQCGRAGQVITAHLPWTQALADQFNHMFKAGVAGQGLQCFRGQRCCGAIAALRNRRAVRRATGCHGRSVRSAAARRRRPHALHGRGGSAIAA